MTFPQIVEVAIGLVLVYYVMGSVVSAATQFALDFFHVRRRIFYDYMSLIFGSKKYKSVIDMPQAKSFGTRIPIQILVDAFLDISGFSAQKELELSELAAIVDKLPNDSDAKHAMAAWINQGIYSPNDIRVRLTDYLTGLLDNIESDLSAKSRYFMIIIALSTTLLTGIDSLQLAGELWKNSELRAVALQSSNIATNDGNKNSPSTTSTDITGIPIKIGWGAKDFPVNVSVRTWLSFLFFKVVGLGITVACVSQGSAFWLGLLKKLG